MIMYVCPMHPEVRQPTPGKCPKCGGMELVPEGVKITPPKRKVSDFLPLIVIFIVIVALTGIMVWRQGGWETMEAMRYFEGFFFLVFGIFKLLNWKGFVDAYSTYDLIAKRSRLYGYAYPLIELALAACYLIPYRLETAAWVTLVLMVIGAIGVAKKLKQKEQIPCACLGVVFKIPMTYVTFIEDVLMAAMALAMIMLLK